MTQNLFFVSIIIPVFNDAERLKKCLQALENQTYSKDSYEIIVVDNNSEEDIESIVKQFNQARIAHESYRGSYAARNKGISSAKGKILGFTDSDCIPAPNWIEKGVEHLLKTPNCGLVAGKIELFFQNPDNPTAVELYDSMYFLRQKYYVETLNFGATANLFTFKDVFENVGLFNSQLKSGGDQEWGRRVFASGYAQVYSEDTCIAHPARKDLKELQKKMARVVEGIFYLENQNKLSKIEFFQGIIKDLKPSLRQILEIFSNTNIKSTRRKLALIKVIYSLKIIKVWNKIIIFYSQENHRFIQTN
jgi:glycosyltransferase involved in cell wall biosynthesis